MPSSRHSAERGGIPGCALKEKFMAKMMKVGLVGWRGMVGSVLVGRMQEERDFDHVRTTLFSTSQAGQAAIALPNTEPVVGDAGAVCAL
jgi:aspartate-semialdehyde dehydrogenase